MLNLIEYSELYEVAIEVGIMESTIVESQLQDVIDKVLKNNNFERIDRIRLRHNSSCTVLYDFTCCLSKRVLKGELDEVRIELDDVFVSRGFECSIYWQKAS